MYNLAMAFDVTVCTSRQPCGFQSGA